MSQCQSRKLYLVRHGMPQFPGGERRCIGRTEIPLGEHGRKQAKELQEYWKEHPVTAVFTSPLSRCVETAEILADGQCPVKVKAELQELDMGEWENVPLQQLQEAGKKELASEPEFGEGRKKGLSRFRQAIEEVLQTSEGDVVCVAHAGVNCCYLADLQGEDIELSRGLPQPYGGISIIEVDPAGEKRVVQCGVMPRIVPDEAECRQLWEHYHTPKHVQAHCKAVAEVADEIGRMLNANGCSLNLELIRGAALLHDVARAREHHAEQGEKILRREGYPVVAQIIRAHHDLTYLPETQQSKETFTEAEVVYLADKYVYETTRVTLEERFMRSLRRCLKDDQVAEALLAHDRRYQEARQVAQKMDRYTGEKRR